MDAEKSLLETFRKRWDAAEQVKEDWEKEQKVERCYNFWRGDQLAKPFDRFGNERIQVNKIAPEVKNAIAATHFYRPFARVNPRPEREGSAGNTELEDVQLLQDTVNYLMRQERIRFGPSTYLAHLESFWSMGVVEVGYSATFADDPGAAKPSLKEKKDTKVEKEPLPLDKMTDEDVEAELTNLKKSIKKEDFYVKHIPVRQFLVSISDKPLADDNDWFGYWEDVPVEDVKAAGKQGVYSNTEKLQPGGDDSEEGKSVKERNSRDEKLGNVDRIRLYKLWDMRRKVKYVYTDKASGAKDFLLKKPFKRLPLKFYRPMIDPYHFLPIPPIKTKLGPQMEYNASRDWLTKLRNGIVPRYTYDEDAVDDTEMQKLEKGIMGTYIKRKAGTHNVIEPVNQPSFSENAIQTLTLSDKEFKDVGGIGGDARVAQSKTATQAKIAEAKEQVQDDWDRLMFGKFLGEVAEELLNLALDHMVLDNWIAVNVGPESGIIGPQGMPSPDVQTLTQQYTKITSERLQAAASGMDFDIDIDIDSMSPVTEEQRFQKLVQAIGFVANPESLKVLAVAPPLLKIMLAYMGIRNGNEVAAIQQAFEGLVQIQMAQAQAGAPPAPGISPQPGGAQPGQPSPQTQQGTPGGPQPGGPAGPGASVPKQPQ